MLRSKAMLRQSKAKSKKSSQQQSPETADEYQAAGVELEEAGEKWRAGDAVKSMRFFTRAVETYDRGLQRFPTSQDLAYNKARAQLETATHPLLVRQLQAPLTSVLESTLASHRYVLDLNPDQADTLFNTAQVLISLAEEISKNDSGSELRAVKCLEEAWQLLERCYSLQEREYMASQQPPSDSTEVPGQNEDDEMSVEGTEHEQWAAIVEPVTKETLVDTAIAKISALTTLCSVIGNAPGDGSSVINLAWVEEQSSQLLHTQLGLLAEGSDRDEDMSIAKAVFLSNMLEAAWRKGKIELATYLRERDAAFVRLPTPLSYGASMANVASLLAANNAISEVHDFTTTSVADLASSRWSTLATAISQLAAVGKNPEIIPEDLPSTHLLRGDASLHQYQLSKTPLSYSPALKNATALLKNAEVFYRNASRLTHDESEKGKSIVQEAIVVALQSRVAGGKAPFDPAVIERKAGQAVRTVIDEMVAEGLLDDEDLDRLEFRR